MTQLKPLRPIGPVRRKVSGSIKFFPPIILGGATFSKQYNYDPQNVNLTSLIRRAFELGITAIDTSPYYGVSEIVIGEALAALASEYSRDQYYLCTKVGRIDLDDFNYSPKWVLQSVERSLQRLKTTHLDLVYLHDIEFQSEEQIYGALKQLRKLKDEGTIHHFGISGYPVNFLAKISSKVVSDPEIGSLDAVLSYSHFNVHNTILANYYEVFKKEAHIEQVSSASILSMSLLRTAPVLPFHPGSQALKDAVKHAAQVLLDEDHEELADFATRFAIREWFGKGPTVIGVCSVAELEAAIEQYWLKDDEESIARDRYLLEKFRKLIGPKHINETWKSGIQHQST